MRALRIYKGAALLCLWGFTVALVLLWDQNIFSIAASALGVAATLLLVFSLRWWKGVAAIASALFVVNWALAFVSIDTGGSSFRTYLSVIAEAMRTGSVSNSAVVLGYEAALPLVHLIITIVLCVGLLKKKPVD